MAEHAGPALDTTATIETPEHVSFSVRVVGPARRILAFGIDAIIRVALFIACAVAAASFGFSVELEEAAGGVFYVAFFLLDWAYYVLCESLMNGQSPGKRALGLRVVKEGGHPVTFLDIVLRNLLRSVDGMPLIGPPTYLVGIVVMGFDTRFRRLGDLVAGTMVVSEQRSALGGALQISPPTAEELATIPQGVHLMGDEFDAVELYLRRANRLNPARDQELAEMLAPALAARFGLKYQYAGRFLALLYLRSGGEIATQAQGRRGAASGPAHSSYSAARLS